MTIRTRFNVGDVVWIIFNNRPETWKVQGITLPRIKQAEGGDTMPTYSLVHHGPNHIGHIHTTEAFEYEMGASLADLLDMLMRHYADFDTV